MTDSALLGLPYIDAAQSQKHVTHNEALALLDLSVQIAVEAVNLATPPASPVEGQRYHLGASPTGVFAGNAGRIACWQDGAWRFLTPKAGWTIWLGTTNDYFVFDGAAWKSIAVAVRALNNLSLLGIGTTADASNPFAVKANAALLAARTTGEGGTGDLRVALNKPAAGNTVSHVFQTNYSGRAELGLAGDDRFRIKVSAAGTAWLNALEINPATGSVSFPCGLNGAGAGLSFRRLDMFDASGTFVKQAGDVVYQVIAIGGGGGGGAGRRSAASTQAGGGAGGNAGHVVEDWIVAADAAASSAVAIGAGGAGAAAAADSTNGVSGATGGFTTVFTLRARGGTGGGGGTATAGGAAAGSFIDSFSASRFRPSAGGAGNASTLGAAAAHASAAAGGGGGAGLSASDVEAAGGSGAGADQTNAVTVSNGGNGGTTTSPNGASAVGVAGGRFGAGGGGGASKAAAAAGNGGAGAQAGGGGGGGGGGRNGQGGGAGGSGAPGRVLIYVYG